MTWSLTGMTPASDKASVNKLQNGAKYGQEDVSTLYSRNKRNYSDDRECVMAS
jgi:hypothetical protein